MNSSNAANNALPGSGSGSQNAAADETGARASSYGQRLGNRRSRSDRNSKFSGPYIAAIVVGFYFFWPIGLALLAWALWSDQIKAMPLVQKFMQGDLPKAPSMPNMSGLMGRRPSNSALAEYLAQEQSRIKAEQHKLDELVKAFEAFKSAESQATDRRDFEEFLRHREATEGETPSAKA